MSRTDILARAAIAQLDETIVYADETGDDSLISEVDRVLASRGLVLAEDADGDLVAEAIEGLMAVAYDDEIGQVWAGVDDFDTAEVARRALAGDYTAQAAVAEFERQARIFRASRDADEAEAAAAE